MIVSTVVTLSVLMCVPKSSYTIITVQYSMRHAGSNDYYTMCSCEPLYINMDIIHIQQLHVLTSQEMKCMKEVTLLSELHA